MRRSGTSALTCESCHDRDEEGEIELVAFEDHCQRCHNLAFDRRFGSQQVVHRSLDSRATCYAIVNESRRLIRSDRVSITLRRGKRQKVVAVSGLDSIDRRADEVRRFGGLFGPTCRRFAHGFCRAAGRLGGLAG